MNLTNIKTPCLTLRPTTDRPIVCAVGNNMSVPFDLSGIKKLTEIIDNENYKKGEIPFLWDIYATKRILEILLNTNLKVK